MPTDQPLISTPVADAPLTLSVDDYCDRVASPPGERLHLTKRLPDAQLTQAEWDSYAVEQGLRPTGYSSLPAPAKTISKRQV